MTTYRAILRGDGRLVRDSATLLLGLALVSGLAGCMGGDGSDVTRKQVSASGKVEFDGKPLPAGSVSFLEESTGNLATCEISDGAYQSESGMGPTPGKTVVSVMGKQTEEGDDMWARPWKKQVVVGEADFTEDFSIKTTDVKPFDPKSRPIDN